MVIVQQKKAHGILTPGTNGPEPFGNILGGRPNWGKASVQLHRYGHAWAVLGLSHLGWEIAGKSL